MPIDQSQKLLRELEEKARLYAQKSTKMSNQLEEAEQFLQAMPGKMLIAVVGNRHWDKLEFCRKSDEWRLFYGTEAEGAWVTEASVDIKAKAARLLPELVIKLLKTQTENLTAVEKGLEALSAIPFLKGSGQGGEK